jgi:hypothetical protein
MMQRIASFLLNILNHNLHNDDDVVDDGGGTAVTQLLMGAASMRFVRPLALQLQRAA